MYLERRTQINPKGKKVYQDLVECPSCNEQWWQWKANGTYCKSCAGQISYTLPQVSYSLIQNGFIEFDRSSGAYRLSTSAQKWVEQHSVNSGKLLPDGAGDNPEPSPLWGRCNDYPFEEYAQVGGSAERLTS